MSRRQRSIQGRVKAKITKKNIYFFLNFNNVLINLEKLCVNIMCSFFAIHRQKNARNSGAKVDDPLKGLGHLGDQEIMVHLLLIV